MTARVIPIREDQWRTRQELQRDRFTLLADLKRWGQPAGHYAGADADLAALERKGLIRAEGERWALTDKGRVALACHENDPTPRGAA